MTEITCTCGKKFNKKTAKDQHVRDAPIHNEAGALYDQNSSINYAANRNCGRSFAIEDALEQHRRALSRSSTSAAKAHPTPDPIVVVQPTVSEPIPMPHEPQDDRIGGEDRRAIMNEQMRILDNQNEIFDMHDSLQDHMKLLKTDGKFPTDSRELEELRMCPVFTPSVYLAVKNRGELFPAFALLASDKSTNKDPRLFLNVNTPWSAFICGSQGSGKSHSFSCILENFLVCDRTLGRLTLPLTGLVFHYDNTSSDTGGYPSEAAYLASCDVPVRVLVAASNEHSMRELYSKIDSKIAVQPLYIDQADLNVSSLLTLMAIDEAAGKRPLYMDIVKQILRDMPHTTMQGFDYNHFRKEIKKQNLTPDQRRPLDQRIQLLESFIRHNNQGTSGVDWSPVARELTIVDLSCPFVSADIACNLFDICLRLFLSQGDKIGRFVALDEAHKFLNKSDATSKLTQSLIDVIRQQRHLGCRVIIATQEPTVSPTLIDLCSITLVHRFTSPHWYRTLQSHVAAVAAQKGVNEEHISSELETEYATVEDVDQRDTLFSRILDLNVGEAVFCAPTAILHAKSVENSLDDFQVHRLGKKHLVVKIRARLSQDGGQSIMLSR